MIKKIFFAISLLGSTVAFAQEGILKIQVTDSINGEPVSFAVVRVESAGGLAASGQTDVNGKLVLKNLHSGEYTVITAFSGYAKNVIGDVLIENRQTTELDVLMSTNMATGIVITHYRKPLIQPYGTDVKIFDRDEIEKSPLKPMELVNLSGVETKPGISPSFHGARQDANVIYIDGMRVIGSADLPRMGVEQVSITLGGIPAQFGDGTGGFIELETRSGLVYSGK